MLGTSGVVFAARDRYAIDPDGRLHAFCHALADRWHVMAVILSAAGALSWLQHAVGEARDRDTADRGRALGAGGRGPDLRALPVGRADPACRRRRPRWIRRPRPAPRPRRAGPSGAGGSRARARRRARADRRNRAATTGGTDLRRRLARRSCGAGSSPRCSTFRCSAPPRRRAPRLGRRCSAVSPRARSHRRPTRLARPFPSSTRSSLTLTGSGPIRSARERYRALYPALSTLPAVGRLICQAVAPGDGGHGPTAAVGGGGRRRARCAA